eukprot:6145429-Pyramimonas_sp.AAC.1
MKTHQTTSTTTHLQTANTHFNRVKHTDTIGRSSRNHMANINSNAADTTNPTGTRNTDTKEQTTMPNTHTSNTNTISATGLNSGYI